MLFLFPKIYNIINKIIGRNRVKNKLNQTMIKEKTNTIANLATGYEFKREVFPLAFAENLIQHPFEDGEYPIFSEYAKALEIQYGSDFMEIPDLSVSLRWNRERQQNYSEWMRMQI